MARTAALTIIRHETTGNILSVYRGTPHLGLIYNLGECGYMVRADAPFCDTLPDALLPTEAAAIAYLAGA